MNFFCLEYVNFCYYAIFLNLDVGVTTGRCGTYKKSMVKHLVIWSEHNDVHFYSMLL